MDFNDVGEERRFGQVIPDGTFVKLVMNIRPGGANAPNQDAADNGLFRASDKSDAIMLECELTVTWPAEYEHRKIFERLTVHGGQLDDKGASKGWNIAKQRLRAILESATGTSKKDTSAQAKANRTIANFQAFENCPFFAKLTVETDPDGKYPPKNIIDYVVTADDPEYALMKAGQNPEPKPRYSSGKAAPGQGKAAAGTGPAWAAKPGESPQPTSAPAPAPQAPTAPKPAWMT
jgi:hypothetical protein